MVNFEYYTPTKVMFGKNTEAQVGELAAEFGARKVLVHFGGESARKSGLLARVEQSLENQGLSVIELGGVVPNPRLSLVRLGIELCKKEGVDFILAVGGGSVIDSAKAIAFGAKTDQDIWAMFEEGIPPKAALPVGVVLTLAAAGSEMSIGSVITNEETLEKRSTGGDLGRPKFAVLNPELTMTLPAYQTAVGAVDILMHTMERYFTAERTMELTDGIAEALMRTVLGSARRLMRRPNDYEARAELMWAGSLSHNGLTGAGGGGGDWSCHQLSHELSGRFDLAHGAALSAIWGSWARYVYKQDPGRFAQFAEMVMEVPAEGSDETMALAGIEEMENFFWAVEVPTSIGEAGIELSPELIEEMARGCSRNGTRRVGSILSLTQDDMKEIYKMAR